MAERGGHAPHHAECATISLAKNPGSLVRFTFHGAHGEIRTRTVRILSSAPLLIGLRGRWEKCSRSDSHRHFAGFRSAASALGYGSESGPGGRTRTCTRRGLSSLPLHWATPGKMRGAPGRSFACNLRVRSAARYTLRHGSFENWYAGTVPPRLLRNVGAAIC